MEDFSKMLEQLMSTEEGQKGFKEAMSLLGGSSGSDDKTASFADNIKNSFTGNSNSGDDGPLIDPKMLLTLQSIFTAMPKNDESSNFLRALKPLLKPQRQKKADEAIKMLRLFSMLPALAKSGLLKNLF